MGTVAAVLVLAEMRRRGMRRIRDATQAMHDDIERRKIVEADLSRAKRELEESARVRTEFVAGVSHELRTPLANMLGYAELLADGTAGALTPPQAKLLAVVDRNAHRLHELVEDMLILSRIGTANRPRANKPVDVSQLLHHAAQEFVPELVGRDITIVVDAEAGVGTIIGDQGQLQRVLHNLVANAVKYTSDGGKVTVAASRVADCMTITVTDTGMGIKAQDQNHVFEPFFRSDAARRSNVQGAGLGLATARAIIEAHAGRLELTSEPGLGTAVAIRLPLDRMHQPVTTRRLPVGAQS